MKQVVIENPILNSPFEEPGIHCSGPFPMGREEENALFPDPSPLGHEEEKTLTPGPSPRGRGEDGSLSLRERVGVRANFKPALPDDLLKRIGELRKNETEAEHLLWQLVRNRNLAGFKFRRQHPIDGYILDFYCHEAKLGIELDGGHHNEPKQAQYDAQRTADLEASGLRILRFWNHEVMNDTSAVVQTILGELSPHPDPLPPGEGGLPPLPSVYT